MASAFGPSKVAHWSVDFADMTIEELRDQRKNLIRELSEQWKNLADRGLNPKYEPVIDTIVGELRTVKALIAAHV